MITEEIHRAINNKYLVEVTNKGGKRIVEPHMVANNEKGNLVLLAWFVRGYSSSGSSPSFREYFISEITGIQVLSEQFNSARPGYAPDGGQKFHSIVCSLQ